MKCVVILFTLTNLLNAQGLQPQDVYKRTIPSIITLSVLKENQEIGIGTAFLSIKDGIAVTAWHVVSGARSVTARFSSGEEYEVSGLVDKDEKRDLAFIRVKVFDKPMLKIDSKEADIGAKAYVIGTPRGLEFSISDGIISQVQSFDSFKQYQFSCPASPGNSGGPLLNSRGEVLGVVSWQVRDGQNLNFAIPCIYVLGLDASLPTQPWSSVKSSVPIISASIEKADKIIADAVTISQDLWLSCQFTYKNIVRKKNGYQLGLPYQLYSFLEESQRISSQLNDIVQTRSIRQSIAELKLYDLSQQIKGAELLVQAIKMAQDNQGWSTEATDAVTRSLGAFEIRKQFDTTALALMSKSNVFRNSLPKSLQVFLGFTVDTIGYALGVDTWVNSTLDLVQVQENSFASQLGFRDGDRIISIDGIYPGDLDAFKWHLKQKKGKTIPVTILREGEEQSIKIYVPNVFPSREN